MGDYNTLALVLDKESRGEYGNLIHIFTKELGRIEARTWGSRKIVSKLSPHLEPNFFSEIRLIEKNGFLITDALREGKKNFSWEVLTILKNISAPIEKNEEIWKKIEEGEMEKEFLLKHFGFDPKFSGCSICGNFYPKVFYLKEQEFLCGNCLLSLKVPIDEVIYI